MSQERVGTNFINSAKSLLTPKNIQHLNENENAATLKFSTPIFESCVGLLEEIEEVCIQILLNINY